MGSSQGQTNWPWGQTSRASPRGRTGWLRSGDRRTDKFRSGKPSLGTDSLRCPRDRQVEMSGSSLGTDKLCSWGQTSCALGSSQGQTNWPWGQTSRAPPRGQTGWLRSGDRGTDKFRSGKSSRGQTSGAPCALVGGGRLPAVPSRRQAVAYFFPICSIAFCRWSSKYFSSGSFMALAISTAF